MYTVGIYLCTAFRTALQLSLLSMTTSLFESLDLLIRCEGWQPETSESAQEFLLPRPLVPSCLILDVSLDGLDGLELQKRIASKRPDMPIILISGRGDIRATVRAVKAGAVDFLVKPFSNDVLLRSIRESLERSRVALDREVALRDLRHCYASLTHSMLPEVSMPPVKPTPDPRTVKAGVDLVVFAAARRSIR